jgi:hypothetical protein
VWTLLTGKPADQATSADSGPGALATAVVGLLKPADDFRQPGTYQVTIPQVHLDPGVFKAGHTVDIQARVLKVDPRGRSTTVWETRPYGERLAVAGKDELSAGWPQRPFQIDWHPGERLMVEVYDRRTGLLAEPSQFVLAPAEAEPREFPLKPGTFSLEPARKVNSAVDPHGNRIVLKSQRLGDLASTETSQADDHPIVIK